MATNKTKTPKWIREIISRSKRGKRLDADEFDSFLMQPLQEQHALCLGRLVQDACINKQGQHVWRRMDARELEWIDERASEATHQTLDEAGIDLRKLRKRC